MLNFEPCCPSGSVCFILIVFYMSVFYEQINDDDDDESLDFVGFWDELCRRS